MTLPMTLKDAYPYPFEYLNPDSTIRVRLWDADWHLLYECTEKLTTFAYPRNFFLFPGLDVVYRTIDYPNGSRYSDMLVRTEYGLEVRTYEDWAHTECKRIISRLLGIPDIDSFVDTILVSIFDDVLLAQKAYRDATP